jgi:hypothetical protein
MNGSLKAIVAFPRDTVFDRSAVFSVLIACAAPPVTFLILVLGFATDDYFTSRPYLYREFDYWTGGFGGILIDVLVSLFVSEVVSFVLGIVSLTGKRSRPSSARLANIGIAVSVMVGILCCLIAECLFWQ